MFSLSLSLSLSLSFLFFTRILDRGWNRGSCAAAEPFHRAPPLSILGGRIEKQKPTLDPSRMHHPRHRLRALLDIAPSCLGYLFRLIARGFWRIRGPNDTRLFSRFGLRALWVMRAIIRCNLATMCNETIRNYWIVTVGFINSRFAISFRRNDKYYARRVSFASVG